MAKADVVPDVAQQYDGALPVPGGPGSDFRQEPGTSLLLVHRVDRDGPKAQQRDVPVQPTTGRNCVPHYAATVFRDHRILGQATLAFIEFGQQCGLPGFFPGVGIREGSDRQFVDVLPVGRPLTAEFPCPQPMVCRCPHQAATCEGPGR